MEIQKIGIIGGAGPIASGLFYELLVKESIKKKKKLPELIIVNYPFTRGLTEDEEVLNEGRIKHELIEVTSTLNRNQVDAGLIVCNTLHRYMESIHKEFHFLSLPDIVLKEIKKEKNKSILILSTPNTAKYALYEDNEIKTHYLTEEHQLTIGDIIDRVLSGLILAEDSLAIRKIINEEQKYRRVDAIVLGCTELPVLHHHHPISLDIPIYDSIKNPVSYITNLLPSLDILFSTYSDNK